MIEDATNCLVEPEAPEPSLRAGWVDATDISSALSPTYWGNELVKEVTGFDLFGQVGVLFAGDWEAYAKAGVALGHLAEFCDVTGRNFVHVAAGLDEGWDGNASDAAVAYVSSIAVTVMRLAEPLRVARDNYTETAKGVWSLANQATNLAEALVDSCLIAAGAAAVGTVLVETGVGAVVGWGIAALEIANAMRIISKLTALSVSVNMAVMAGVGAIKVLEGHLVNLDDLPLPGAAYHHPANSR